MRVLQQRASIYPAERLKNRLFREFRRRSMTVTAVSKMSTKILENAPPTESETTVGNMTFKTKEERTVIPKDVVGYYWGLRTLMYAWAQAGNYLVDSVLNPGKQVLMMPLHVALDYADRFLQTVLASNISEETKLSWGERQDRTTRSVMASLVRPDGGKYPAQEALLMAINETATNWATVGGLQVIGAHQDIAELDQGAECSTEANSIPLGKREKP